MSPEDAASGLLSAIGKTDGFHVVPLHGGRNNFVWRVDSGAESFLLKKYSWSEADPRDRLGQEWMFLEFLQSAGCRLAPAPLAKDTAHRFALLEFFPGEPPGTLSEADILDAAGFFAAINSRRDLATHLPPVSEACFSLDAHVATTARRVELLSRIEPSSSEHSAAGEFVRSTIQPLWKKIRSRIETIPATVRSLPLPRSHQCLSPSDFGFHNALRQPDGRLRYIDFEYAGWDDPAKTLIDFTNQPDRLLPENLAALFLEKTIPLFPDPRNLRERLAILTPLYQLKWACICLNAFLPARPHAPSRPLADQLTRSRIMALRAAASLDASGD
jgi:hypothetical protein